MVNENMTMGLIDIIMFGLWNFLWITDYLFGQPLILWKWLLGKSYFLAV